MKQFYLFYSSGECLPQFVAKSTKDRIVVDDVIFSISWGHDQKLRLGLGFINLLLILSLKKGKKCVFFLKYTVYKKSINFVTASFLERKTGFKPAPPAWKASALRAKSFAQIL